MQIQVLHNQTLLDVAIRYCGSVNALLDIAILNSVSVTANLQAGQFLTIPETDYGTKEISKYFEVNNIQPANALTLQQVNPNPEFSGIDYMAIENDFIVQ